MANPASKIHMNFVKFEMRNLDNTSVVVMIAKRGSGKSVLIKDLLYHKRHDIDTVIVISPTEKDNKCYGNVIPDTFIYSEYHQRIITKIFDRQDYMRKKNEKRIKKGKKPIRMNLIIVMDDCMYDTKWTKETVMRSVFYNGRHSKLMLILSLQYSLAIPPAFRGNIDYVFLLADNNNANRKRYFDNFAGMFPNFKFFSRVFTELTSDYKCMIIDNKTKSIKLDEVVYWYKADVRDDYQFGSKRIWKHHKKNYNKYHNSGNRVADINKMDPKMLKQNENIVINLNRT